MNKAIIIFLLVIISVNSNYNPDKIVKDLVENLSVNSVNNKFFIKKFFYKDVKFIRMVFNNKKVSRGINSIMEYNKFILGKIKVIRKRIKHLYSLNNVVTLELRISGKSLEFKRHFHLDLVAILHFKDDRIRKFKIYTDYGNMKKFI